MQYQNNLDEKKMPVPITRIKEKGTIAPDICIGFGGAIAEKQILKK
jgi:hypothetical protein